MTKPLLVSLAIAVLMTGCSEPIIPTVSPSPTPALLQITVTTIDDGGQEENQTFICQQYEITPPALVTLYSCRWYDVPVELPFDSLSIRAYGDD